MILVILGEINHIVPRALKYFNLSVGKSKIILVTISNLYITEDISVTTHANIKSLISKLIAEFVKFISGGDINVIS